MTLYFEPNSAVGIEKSDSKGKKTLLTTVQELIDRTFDPLIQSSLLFITLYDRLYLSGWPFMSLNNWAEIWRLPQLHTDARKRITISFLRLLLFGHLPTEIAEQRKCGNFRSGGKT